MTVTVRDKVRTADHTVDSDSHLRLKFNWEQPYDLEGTQLLLAELVEASTFTLQQAQGA